MTKKELFMYETLRALAFVLVGMMGGLIFAEDIKNRAIFYFTLFILFVTIEIINSMTYAKKYKEFRKSLK